MALVGEELGKDVWQWFRPSTSAGAIKYVDVVIFAAYMLILLFISSVQRFSDASLGISVASTARSSRLTCIRRHIRPLNLLVPTNYRDEGGRAVVVLIGIRPGIDGVNPVDYETIKVCDSSHISRPLTST